MVPFLEEDVLRNLELISTLSSYLLQDFEQIHKGFLLLKLQLRSIKLKIDILPLEIGDTLLTISDEVVDIPGRRCSFLGQVSCIYLSEVLPLQVLLVCH